MITILMVSAKMATPGLRKIKIFKSSLNIWISEAKALFFRHVSGKTN